MSFPIRSSSNLRSNSLQCVQSLVLVYALQSDRYLRYQGESQSESKDHRLFHRQRHLETPCGSSGRDGQIQNGGANRWRPDTPMTDPWDCYSVCWRLLFWLLWAMKFLLFDNSPSLYVKVLFTKDMTLFEAFWSNLKSLGVSQGAMINRVSHWRLLCPPFVFELMIDIKQPWFPFTFCHQTGLQNPPLQTTNIRDPAQPGRKLTVGLCLPHEPPQSVLSHKDKPLKNLI